jgi:hypothetical protein
LIFNFKSLVKVSTYYFLISYPAARLVKGLALKITFSTVALRRYPIFEQSAYPPLILNLEKPKLFIVVVPSLVILIVFLGNIY